MDRGRLAVVPDGDGGVGAGDVVPGARRAADLRSSTLAARQGQGSDGDGDGDGETPARPTVHATRPLLRRHRWREFGEVGNRLGAAVMGVCYTRHTSV